MKEYERPGGRLRVFDVVVVSRRRGIKGVVQYFEHATYEHPYQRAAVKWEGSGKVTLVKTTALDRVEVEPADPRAQGTRADAAGGS